jgi:hypothetical protein
MCSWLRWRPWCLGSRSGGHDWADRIPAIVDAAARLKAQSSWSTARAVIARDDGMPNLDAFRSKHRGHEAVLFAFDLIKHDGDDLRDLLLIERKPGQKWPQFKARFIQLHAAVSNRPQFNIPF